MPLIVSAQSGSSEARPSPGAGPALPFRPLPGIPVSLFFWDWAIWLYLYYIIPARSDEPTAQAGRSGKERSGDVNEL